MMKINFKEKFIALASIIGILLLILIIAPLFSNTKSTSRKSAKMLFPDLKTSLVSEIKISHGKDSVVLSNSEQKWYVSYGPNKVIAKAEEIYAMLGEVKKLTVGRTVEKKPKTLSTYNLDEEFWYRFELTDTKANSFVILIGREDSTYQKRFVAFEDLQAVYETAIPSSMLRYQNRDWASLNIFSSANGSANVIEFSLFGKDPDVKDGKPRELNYTVVASSVDSNATKWIFKEDNLELNSSTVSQFVRTLTRASFYDYVFDQTLEQARLTNPVATISTTGDDGIVRTLAIGKKIEDKYYCLLGATNSIVLVNNSVIDEIIRDKKSLAE